MAGNGCDTGDVTLVRAVSSRIDGAWWLVEVGSMDIDQ
jgi:hypothetical protein